MLQRNLKFHRELQKGILWKYTPEKKCDVLTLEDSVLKIKIDEHGITFHGRGLCIDLYNADGIIISGDICTVELD